MKNVRCLSLAILAVLAVLGSCPRTAAAAGAPGGKEKAKGAAKTRLKDLPDAPTPIEYESPEGRFQAVYPSGCARLFTRSNVVPDSIVATQIYIVNCDRAGIEHEGCSVIARLGDLRNLQGKAAADRVMTAMTKQLAAFGAQPFQQTPLRRDFGEHGIVEGLDIRAHKVNGQGDFWIRGLLHGEDAYLILGWKASGDMWTDPEFAVFFDSFRPWTN